MQHDHFRCCAWSAAIAAIPSSLAISFLAAHDCAAYIEQADRQVVGLVAFEAAMAVTSAKDRPTSVNGYKLCPFCPLVALQPVTGYAHLAALYRLCTCERGLL